jgi:hypothetical protein
MPVSRAEAFIRILIAYDGSPHANAAIDDLRRAGLPRQAEALVVSVAHRGWPEVENATMEPGLGYSR